MTVPARKRTRPYLPLHEEELDAIERRLFGTDVKKAQFFRAAVLEAFEDDELFDRVMERASGY